MQERDVSTGSCNVFPRPDVVATGRDRARARIDRRGSEAHGRGGAHPGDSRGALSHRHCNCRGTRRAQPSTTCVAFTRQVPSVDRAPGEAHAALAPALEGFSPTPEMPEIAEAQALLSRLAYDPPFKFTGKIDRLTFELGPDQASEAKK